MVSTGVAVVGSMTMSTPNFSAARQRFNHQNVASAGETRQVQEDRAHRAKAKDYKAIAELRPC